MSVGCFLFLFLFLFVCLIGVFLGRICLQQMVVSVITCINLCTFFLIKTIYLDSI